MNQDQSKQTNRRWIGYVVYCILLVCILLYYRFPSEAFGDYLQNTINKNYPALSVSIKGVSPSLPAGIKLTQMELTNKETPEDVLFRAESLSVGPKILSLFKGTPEVLFECLTSGGKMTGNIQLTEKSLKGSLQTAFTLNNIRINEESTLSTAFGRQIDGIINGSGTLNGKISSLITGSGDAEFSLSDVRINLLQPIMSLEYIEFNEIVINTNLKNRKLDLPNIKLKGEKMNGTVSGALYLKNNLSESRLDLEGSVEPTAELVRDMTGGSNAAAILNQTLKGGKLSFKINGTLKDPKVRFL